MAKVIYRGQWVTDYSISKEGGVRGKEPQSKSPEYKIFWKLKTFSFYSSKSNWIKADKWVKKKKLNFDQKWMRLFIKCIAFP